MSKLLILVDGSSYLYRAFHALPQLTNSKGFSTGAIYGVINMLKRLMLDYPTENIAVVFDAKGKTFRDDLYKEYKATRQKMPDDLSQQIEPLHQILKSLGLPIIIIPGVEADDVIGTLAIEATKHKIPVLISTGDKDLAQLVNEEITLINTMNNKMLNPSGVLEKFGVLPERIIDYLTLIGDTSDNIPGVNKVGPKTAAKWLQTFGTLDNLVEKNDEIKGKVGEYLRAFLPQLELTKTLVTIKTDLSLPVNVSDLILQERDKAALINLYKELEFKNWLSELLSETENIAHKKYEQYKTILDESAFDKFVSQLLKASIFAFNIETTHSDPRKAKIVGISFALNNDSAVYIPLGHDYQDAPKQIAKKYIFNKLKPILEDQNITKITHHLKYHSEMLLKEGIEIKNCIYDTMLESYILDSASNSHVLEGLSLKYLGWRTLSYEEIAGKGSKQISLNHLGIEKVSVYASEKVDLTLKLHDKLYERLLKEPTLNSVFEKIEMPLIAVLGQMEREGVLIDPEQLKTQEIELTKRLKELEKDCYQIAGLAFNVNSPKQLQEILFEKLKLPVLQKTPTGQPSTADPILQELAIDFKLPKLIIECRSLAKLISTYTSKLILQINSDTGRLHTTYNQTGTATGRLSSSDPNLQNIPIRSIEGRKIREAFIAKKDFLLLSADYSQIELRLMAHLSNDENLISAFLKNIDIHQATASEVWGVPLEKVSIDMRRNAKAINFGLIYGISAFGLTRQLGISREESQNYINRYFTRYPAVMDYMNNIKKKAKETGYVETLWGRRLYLPDINASQIPRQRAAERVAINAPLQGSAADIIKMAMINIHQWLNKHKLASKMIMQVHDELVFEVHLSEIDFLKNEIKKQMTEVASLKVPLLVSMGIGKNWNEASTH